ncbi:MAG: ATP phosphoribosyltransferase regulatory subunit [Rhodospirillales bacterium]|nr:ATP phosphoribosyltransferase regulatory subunit [Rhodospirillales bacterium]
MADSGLLPQGLRDILPPDAGFEAAVVERLLSAFAARGYERVKPPLIEFEDGFLKSAGADVARQTFRLMDPESRRMLALRSDITPQVARIAATRLKDAPRPLRLSYAGQVLQVSGGQLRPERQFGQAGIELIGAEAPAADAEVVVLAAEALRELGLEDLAIDLNLPTLVATAAASLGFDDVSAATLRSALDRKDEAAVSPIAGRHAEIFIAMLRAFGPAEQALERLGEVALPRAARDGLDRLAEVVALVRRRACGLALTLDPVEHRGFEYQTGLSFILFSPAVGGELGRGGRYRTGSGESATGFTLYTDTLLRALPRPEAPRRLLVAAELSADAAAALRREGWVTLSALSLDADPMAEARRLGCSHVWIDGTLQPVP